MTGNRIDVLHAVTSSLSLVLLRGQLEYLQAAGFHPAVVCGSGPESEEMRAAESIPVFTVEMEREISPWKDLVSLVRVTQLVRRLRPLVSNSGTPKAGLLVGLAAWLNRVPCRIYTLRGLRLETATGAKRWLLRLTERIACACAHRVICVSPSLRRRAVELGLVPPEKAIVLASGSSNGVDPSRFLPTAERLAKAAEFRRRHGLEHHHRVIGYVGRFTRDKGLPELMAAFRLVRQRFPSAALLLVGSYERGDPVPPETCTAIESDLGVTASTSLRHCDLLFCYGHVGAADASRRLSERGAGGAGCGASSGDYTARRELWIHFAMVLRGFWFRSVMPSPWRMR